jgi:polysaccharide biosynthesis transport protein
MMNDIDRSSSLPVILRRHAALAGVVFLAVFATAIAAYLVIPTRYVATAAIIVAQQDLGLDTAKTIGIDKLGDPADLESQLLLVRSPRVLRMILGDNTVREALGRECRNRASGLSMTGGSCEQLFADMDKLREKIAERFNIIGAGRSRVINVNYESPLADVAQTMANTLTMTFLTDRRDSMTARREEAASLLRGQLSQIESALRADEDRIQQFRRKNGLLNGSTAAVSSERLTGTIQALSAAEAGRADASAKLNAGLEGGDYIDSQNALASRAIGDIKQQISTIDAQIASEANLLGPLHPVLQSLERQRAALRRRLDTEIANVSATTKRRLSAAQKTASEIKTSLGTLKNEAADALDNEIRISALVRENESRRQQIGDISRKIGELEIQKRTISPGTDLVNLAELPVIPFFPKLVPFTAGGLVLALLCAVGAALFTERRRQASLGLTRKDGSAPVMAAPPQDAGMTYAGRMSHIRPANHNGGPPAGGRHLRRVSGQEAGTAAKSPVMASFDRLAVPGGRLPFRQKDTLKAVLREASADQATRASYDRLIAALDDAAAQGPLATLLFAAPVPGVGQTSLVLGLAETLAAGGAEVLVIEADMEKPVLRAALGLEASPGLAGVLTGRTSVQKALVQGSLPTLSILPAGTRPQGNDLAPDRRAIASLLTWAQRFDHVLIDAPAETASPMLHALAPEVDGIVCCARESDPVRDLHALQARLTRAGGRVLGLVQTMATPEPFHAARPMRRRGAAA